MSGNLTLHQRKTVCSCVCRDDGLAGATVSVLVSGEEEAIMMEAQRSLLEAEM